MKRRDLLAGLTGILTLSWLKPKEKPMQICSSQGWTKPEQQTETGRVLAVSKTDEDGLSYIIAYGDKEDNIGYYEITNKRSTA